MISKDELELCHRKLSVRMTATGYAETVRDIGTKFISDFRRGVLSIRTRDWRIKMTEQFDVAEVWTPHGPLFQSTSSLELVEFVGNENKFHSDMILVKLRYS